MSLRVRMIRPSYWTDAALHTLLTADVREFFVGLWMEADDAGYVAWDVDRVGADLYPYRSLAWRRKRIADWAAQLEATGHITILECGRHIVVPGVPRHQSPPRPSYPHQRAHGATCSQLGPPAPSGGQLGAAHKGVGVGVGVGYERGMKGGAARRGANGLTSIEETTVLGERIARAVAGKEVQG